VKLLLWSFVLLVIVVWLFRSKKIAGGTRAPSDSADNKSPIEQIVQCAHCGMHVPASEAVHSAAGAVFCSHEHRLRHADS
jgi:uncharacterized protein